MYTRQLLCVVLIGLVAINHADGAMTREQMEKTAKGLRNSCISKTGADPELVAGILRGEFPDDDRNLQCYTQCIMKTVRTFKNGKLDLDMMLKQIDAMFPAENGPRLKEATRKCHAEVNHEDPCMLSYYFVKCNYDTDKEVFFFP